MIESEIDLSLPYITESLPGIGGQLRSTAEHFVVEELPLYEPSGDGQHLYIRLTKVELTTNEVQKQLAKLFGIKKQDVGFAGMKDKYARTTQTFSLALGHIQESQIDPMVQRIEAELPVTVHWAQRHKNKLKSGHLLGNHFEITITDIELPADEALQRVTAVVDSLRERGIANFFGPQRFGHNGANVNRGQKILLGKQYVKDRWLRRFLVSSYQSYLCNCYLARRVRLGAFSHLLEGDVAKKYATGGMFDVEDLNTEQQRYLDHEISFTAPMYGPKMRSARGQSGQLETEIVQESAITLEHLRKAKVEGTRRLGRLLVPDLQIRLRPTEEKPSVVAEFSLPKGAFATTVLRELMKETE